ncbi:unnamed protein product [Adineta ricciae]|uniref:Uncharacterized protein n=1 Tax=Adineta ricciae TaxID=249248 RepID=A0A815CE70_ADIRI|nr:unnamed protein product [Adineta ricciae]CAF1281637.1 unnamed protein product [Adineta ricciae]
MFRRIGGLVCIWMLCLQIGGAIKEIIVQEPFYLRARIQDSRTASVLFEIARENDQRTCKMYQYTVRRNREYPHSMPEQNLTFWRNSLELKHLDAGDYRVCAIICSEHLRQNNTLLLQQYKNRSLPISACINFRAYRSHFLILTLYILVFIILAFSQIIFSLRKRKFKARIKSALVEVENALQKWRNAQTPSTSVDHNQSYTILQSLVTLPASPIDHSKAPPVTLTTSDEPRPSHPIIFHIENANLDIP